jgi:hypothetical protein
MPKEEKQGDLLISRDGASCAPSDARQPASKFDGGICRLIRWRVTKGKPAFPYCCDETDSWREGGSSVQTKYEVWSKVRKSGLMEGF